MTTYPGSLNGSFDQANAAPTPFRQTDVYLNTTAQREAAIGVISSIAHGNHKERLITGALIRAGMYDPRADVLLHPTPSMDNE